MTTTTPGYLCDRCEMHPSVCRCPVKASADKTPETFEELADVEVVEEVSKPPIEITIEPEAILNIFDALNKKLIPGLYVRGGSVSQVIEVDNGDGPQLVIRVVDADNLRMLLARHADVHRMRTVTKKHKGEDGEVTTEKIRFPVPASPSGAIVKAVLSQADWSLDPLRGVTVFPILRPDGTVLGQHGYDLVTGLYHQPAYQVREVPEIPDRASVKWARALILDKLLVNICWDCDASKANYVALLVTPLMRLYLGGLTPLAVISAVTRGSGKTLLAEIWKAVYGLVLKTWPKHDEECGKVITATLKDDTAPVVLFDNVGAFDTVEHATLAALLTSKNWSGRILGSSSNYDGVNDRLWAVTGNNVSLGGDIASRSVLVRLDPNREDPENRKGFAIPNIWDWLEDDKNRSDVYAALLVLVRDWIINGAQRDSSHTMRNYTTWAQAMGGFLAHHGIVDFLGNRESLAVSDDEETSTAAFLQTWHNKYGSKEMRASDLIDSAHPDFAPGMPTPDPWDSTFPTKADGKPFSSLGLGHFLKARNGRIFAGLKLIGEYEKKRKIWFYRVVVHEAASE